MAFDLVSILTHPGRRDITRRRCSVATSDGPWLSVDVTGSFRGRGAFGFSWLANVLAWRALGALGEGQKTWRPGEQVAKTSPKDAAVLFVAGQVQVLGGLSDAGLAVMERAAGMAADGRTCSPW